MVTRYWYDTEFYEDGTTIRLISIGIVCEDGREYYAVNSEMPVDRILGEYRDTPAHEWLIGNVLPHLPGHPPKLLDVNRRNWYWKLDTSDARVKPRWVIANEVRDFLLAKPDPELWAWYAAYDHVVLCQLWGPMVRLPSGIPMWTNDLQQEIRRAGDPSLPVQPVDQHNALADARWVRDAHHWLGVGRAPSDNPVGYVVVEPDIDGDFTALQTVWRVYGDAASAADDEAAGYPDPAAARAELAVCALHRLPT